jgi:Tfp pilus assembly protein PilX
MKTISRNQLTNNEQGMVAIVITSVLMVVISLIILGFTQTVQRDQRQALDRQLSSQAFYAAESGVNLARKVINEQIDHSEPTDKTTCDESGRYVGTYNVDTSTGAAITCLLVQPNLTSYEYQGVGSDSKVFKIENSTGVTIPYIDFSWQSDPTTPYGSCPNPMPAVTFPTAWVCSEPILRVDIVPLSGAMTQASLRNSQFTSFLYPVTGLGTTSISSSSGTLGNIGTISPVNCNTLPFGTNKYRCSAEIQIASPSSSYGIRIMGVYKSAAVSVTPKDSGHNPVTMVNGQIIVDSTAKAVDVVRRIQTRITLGSNLNDSPDFALETGGATGVCKQYTISGGTYSWPAGSACSIP